MIAVWRGAAVKTIRIAVCTLVLFHAPALFAQSTPLQIPPNAQASPTFDAARATDAWLATVPADQKRRSDAYFEGGYWLDAIQVVYMVALMWALLAFGWSAAMRDRAQRIARWRPLQSAIYGIQFIVTVFVLTFPYSVYRGYFREHQYGLATQTFGPWFGDQLKGLAVGIVLGGLAITVLYAILRRVERSWWLWATAAVVVFDLMVASIFPIFILPLFNTYTRLEDPAVRDPILRMARASGITADAVYVVDESRQTTRISANVTGFLGTERISLNDNLLKRCSLEEIAAVLGHEMGHYVMHHMFKNVLLLAIVAGLGFAFVSRAFGRLKERNRHWGIVSIGDTAGLPLIVLLFTIFQFVAMPVNNTIIRTAEYEADIFGLNAARQPDGFAAVALKLADYRKLDPGPWEEFVFFDHPGGRTRIYSAMRFKAEHLNDLP
jgi:STE24 endopeptidase